MMRGVKWEMVLATLVGAGVVIWLMSQAWSECLASNSFIFCLAALSG